MNWSARFFSLAIACTLGLAATAETESREQFKYAAAKIRIVEDGGVLKKTLKELGSKEAVAVVTAACAAFGSDCSKEAAIAALIIREITKKGNEHRGAIMAPAGYSICQTKLIVRSHDGGTTFNGAISDDNKYIYWYAVVPERVKKRAIDMDIVTELIPTSLLGASRCADPNARTGNIMWSCPKDWYCATSVPGSIIEQPGTGRRVIAPKFP